MKTKHIYRVAVLMLGVKLAFATNAISSWQRNYGYSYIDEARCVRELSNGDLAFLGTYYKGGGSASRVYLIRTTSTGSQLWDDTYTYTSYGAEGHCIRQTDDDGFIISGMSKTSSSSSAPYYIYFFKTDTNGNETWERINGKYCHPYGLTAIRQDSLGSYYATGPYMQPSSTSGIYCDVFFTTYNSSGSQTNWRFYGQSGVEEAGYDIEQTSDGGYIIAGLSDTDIIYQYASDVYVTKLNSTGTSQLWTYQYDGGGSDKAHSVRVLDDGSLIVAGATNSIGAGGYDVYLLKLDSNGNEIWTKTFGGTDDDYGWAVEVASDGGFIIAGWTASQGSGQHDGYIIKTDPNGVEEYSGVRGGASNDEFYSITETSDGGFVAAGATYSFGNSSQAYAAKFFAPRSIQITTPDANDVYMADRTYTMTWQTEGDVENVNVYFTTNGFISYQLLGTNVPNTNQFEWTTPDVDSQTCQILIEDASLGVYDICDPFTIYPCPLTTDLTGDCVVNLADLELMMAEWLMDENP